MTFTIASFVLFLLEIGGGVGGGGEGGGRERERERERLQGNYQIVASSRVKGTGTTSCKLVQGRTARRRL